MLCRKKDSLMARENYIFPFRVKQEGIIRVFESMSVDLAINAVSIQQHINTAYNGKLNIFIIKVNDLKKFSDKKLYKKVKTFTEKDIVSDSLVVEYSGKEPPAVASHQVLRRRQEQWGEKGAQK
jgi:hypothetical protein